MVRFLSMATKALHKVFESLVLYAISEMAKGQQ
jgi:hypothetical protein